MYIAVRPEGLIPDYFGTLECKLECVEVMGRDVSVVSTHEKAQSAKLRAIVGSHRLVDTDSKTVRFRLDRDKTFVFDRESEERLG